MKMANDKDFEQVVDNDKTTLVDFFATWCMPCTMQAKVLEKLEQSRTLDFDIVKVNVDESPELANKFEIGSIPTLIVMKSGVVLKKSVGFSEEAEVLDMVALASEWCKKSAL